jgi:hypothetical protein
VPPEPAPAIDSDGVPRSLLPLGQPPQGKDVRRGEGDPSPAGRVRPFRPCGPELIFSFSTCRSPNAARALVGACVIEFVPWPRGAVGHEGSVCEVEGLRSGGSSPGRRLLVLGLLSDEPQPLAPGESDALSG